MKLITGICTFLVVEITPVSIANIGYRTYIYFAGTQPLPHIFQRTLWLILFYSLQLLFPPSDLFLLPGDAQSHLGTD